VSVDRFGPHLVIVSEDDEVFRYANTFIGHVRMRQMINPPVTVPSIRRGPSGWIGATRRAKETLDRFPLAHVVLVIDFDQSENREESVMSKLDVHRERVLLIGCWREAEELRKGPKRRPVNTTEVIASLAADCMEGRDSHWNIPALAHNLPRIKECHWIRSFLLADPR
jgi:hypothetical protein